MRELAFFDSTIVSVAYVSHRIPINL